MFYAVLWVKLRMDVEALLSSPCPAVIGACVAKGGIKAPVYPGEPEPGGKQVHNQAPKWEEGCQARQRAGAPRMSKRLAEKLGWDPTLH